VERYYEGGDRAARRKKVVETDCWVGQRGNPTSSDGRPFRLLVNSGKWCRSIERRGVKACSSADVGWQKMGLGTAPTPERGAREREETRGDNYRRSSALIDGPTGSLGGRDYQTSSCSWARDRAQLTGPRIRGVAPADGIEMPKSDRAG